MAVDLIKKNYCKSFLIIEKSTGFGGTWRDNKYPGCCCDVWSHLYSYSFAQNPAWSREFADQEEILEYLQDVARKYDLYKNVRFNTSVDAAEWDNDENRWKVSVRVMGGKDAEFGNSYTIQTDFLVSAVGQLNIPKMPSVKGLSEFDGKLMHSARWDRAYDMKDKRVAIIGVGSTGAQIVPNVAKVAASLTVYQRSPNWIVPRLNKAIPEWKQSIYRYFPLVRWLKRSSMMDFREKSYKVVVAPGPGVGEWYEHVSKSYMENQLPNRKDLWERLEPAYRLGCRRVIVSDDFYPTFLADNVKLETGGIDRISTKGIIVNGKEEHFDLIILATGFLSTQFMYPIKVVGRGGRSIESIWRGGAEAFNGVCVEDLPNFAMLYGPNTNLSHNSIILMIEAQSRYVIVLIAEILQNRAAGRQIAIQPKSEKVAEYNSKIQSELGHTNYADPNCNSWYKINGSGKITNNWSNTALLSVVKWSDYDISVVGTAELPKRSSAVTAVGRIKEESSAIYAKMALVSSSAVALGILFTFLSR